MSIATQMRRAAAGVSAGEFNPQTDITWHSLFWAEGTDFVAQGYSDTDSVTTWPNETGETDALSFGNLPTLTASYASLNSQPALHFATTTVATVSSFSVNPTYPISIVMIGRIETAAGFGEMFDGAGSDFSRIYMNSPPTQWRLFAGTIRSGGTVDTNPHLWVARFDGSTGNDRLDVDGTTVIDANAGSTTIQSAVVGGAPVQAYSLVGIYEGDITADGSWASMVAWIEDHYGLSIA